MRIRLVAVIGLAVVFGALDLAARQQSGSIAGRVTLFDGSAAPGVSIVVTAPGVERRTVTDGGSRFTIDNLPPGIYSVRAHLRGFWTETREGLAVGPGRTTQADVSMRMSAFAHVQVPLITHAPWPRELLATTETVAHVRIVEPRGPGRLRCDRHTPPCPEGTFLSTRHAATVLALAKSSPDVRVAVGDRIEFWQLLAGEWREDGRRLVGENIVFAPGDEVVAFLRHDAEFDAIGVASPLPNLVVRSGAVYGIPDGAETVLHNGMSVSAFLAGLRALSAEQQSILSR